MKIVTILGARPQFIKAATVSRAIAERNKTLNNQIEEIIIHTGQHFDSNMSDVFFDQLDIPRPDHNLNINGISHGAMTGRMLEAIENLIIMHRPDCILVYGDTNSTLAGALAAAKLQVCVAHVEAGLRSHNLEMPEEINRILTDRVSNYLFCPTPTAVANLKAEGFPFSSPDRRTQHIENTGDVMYDAMLYYQERARNKIRLENWGVTERGYALCTLHRQENTDDKSRLESILSALRTIAEDICPVLFPLHPRTRKMIDSLGCNHWLDGLDTLDPIAYLEMQRLQMSAQVIVTDSGGIQKEAFFHQVPCITLRDETEWLETVEAGWNQLVGADKSEIVRAMYQSKTEKKQSATVYGSGNAAFYILNTLSKL